MVFRGSVRPYFCLRRFPAETDRTKTPVVLLLLAHPVCLLGGLYVLLAEIVCYLIGGQLSQDIPDRFSRFFSRNCTY